MGTYVSASRTSQRDDRELCSLGCTESRCHFRRWGAHGYQLKTLGMGLKKIPVMENLWYRNSSVLSDVFEGSGLAS